ncbi:Leucine-rich repeat (LRR) protein [Arcanobacterium wilhelmae]|uniref:Leucine-rich repeat (LRR) protein n=1 Tax=Arcanobacterium wilhelmae TaxID=1803177 RepID=A0ABT9NBZ0_9ACTO|nr:leucine-rich repeat domain-containing protein [Arcanobacterium wilhelmae]MDP9801233.1 Leucine-rich repeat (LRR) protein [Arcanobacterium wilhelmae]
MHRLLTHSLLVREGSKREVAAFAAVAVIASAFAGGVQLASAAGTDDVVPDLALRACVNGAMNPWLAKYKPGEPQRKADEPVSASDMENILSRLQVFHCDDKAVKSLEGLQYATGLQRIFVSHAPSSTVPLNQRVSDISPVAKLANLEGLYLGYNNISQLPDMSGMKSLKLLNLEGNGSKASEVQGAKPLHAGIRGLASLKPLAAVSTLEDLNVDYNDVSSLEGLENSTNMKLLKVSHNSISSLAPIAGLTGVTDLRIDSNKISDFSPLAALKNVTYLEMQNNNNLNQLGSVPAPASIDFIANMTKLQDANLLKNDIADAAPLAKLTSLKTLNIGDNKIADLSPIPDSAKVTAYPQFPAGSVAPYSYDLAKGETYVDLSKLKDQFGKQITPSKIYFLGSVGQKPYTISADGTKATIKWAPPSEAWIATYKYPQIRVEYAGGSKVDPVHVSTVVPEKPKPADPTPTPNPTTEAPAPVPTTEAPKPMPTTEAPAPIPTTEAPKPMPTTEAPAPVPTTKPAPAPTTEAPKPMPTTEAPAPVPTTKPAPAPTTEAPAPIPTTEAPKPMPTTEAPAPVPTTKPAPAPTTEAPKPMPTTEAPAPVPTTKPAPAPTTEAPKPAPADKIVTPGTPVFPKADDPANCTVKPFVTVKSTPGVAYFVEANGKPVEKYTKNGDLYTFTYGYGETVKVTATVTEGYQLAKDAQTEWTWKAPTLAELKCNTAAPSSKAPVVPMKPNNGGMNATKPQVHQSMPMTGSNITYLAVAMMATILAGTTMIVRRREN